MMIDKSHPIPVYYQLQQELRRRIEEGEWKPGDCLPSERELSELYSISRMTVRQSLANLVKDGFLRREKGRGTFVAEPRIPVALSRLTGFTQDMRARGLQPGSIVLKLEQVAAPPLVAELLHLNVGDSVILLKRIRLAGDSRIDVQTAYLPDHLFHPILKENLDNQSLYELLLRKFNVSPSRAIEKWEAVACPGEEAQLLGIRKGDPVFRASRTTYNAAGVPFEHVQSIVRGDLYYLHAELHID